MIGRWNDGKARGSPGGESPDEVTCACESQFAQGASRETRAIALSTDDNDRLIESHDLVERVTRSRVDQPLENGARRVTRTGNRAVGFAVGRRTGIEHDHVKSDATRCEFVNGPTSDLGTSLGNDIMNRSPGNPLPRTRARCGGTVIRHRVCDRSQPGCPDVCVEIDHRSADDLQTSSWRETGDEVVDQQSTTCGIEVTQRLPVDRDRVEPTCWLHPLRVHDVVGPNETVGWTAFRRHRTDGHGVAGRMTTCQFAIQRRPGRSTCTKRHTTPSPYRSVPANPDESVNSASPSARRDMRPSGRGRYRGGVTDRITRLWLDARDGNRVAFAEAVRASQADVWRFSRHLVGDRFVDDVTQDTFVRAWRALPSYRGDASARSWLLSIARRAAADAIRSEQRQRRKRTALTPQPLALDDSSDVYGTSAIIAGLGADQRDAFVLTQIIGLTYEEAAQVCGTKVGTIRSRVARAREHLINDLAQAAEA